MSKPPSEIVINPKWKFKIDTSDAEKPVLIEFDYEDSQDEIATPTFMMATILRQHIKAIKTETGLKATEVAFQYFGDFTKKDRRRIKAFLEEACGKLNIAFRSIA